VGLVRKNVWFWHSDTDKLMEYRNFWKGWSGGQKTTLDIKSNFAQVLVKKKVYSKLLQFFLLQRSALYVEQL
jgi:hypothetical protein